MAARWLAPVLIGLAVVLLARAFYVLYVRKRGNFASKLLTWFSALFIIVFWTWRLW